MPSRHGKYNGVDHTSGERYADMTDRAVIDEAHQLRDCVIRVQEGEATGFGIFESIVIGDHPRYGLDGANSFL